MDFGQLATLSNPGQPVQGDLWGQASRWNTLNDMQINALKASIPLAELSAQQDVQKNKEYMLGAPGREDTARLANMNAAEAIKPENFNRAQMVKRMEQELKVADVQAKFNDVTQDVAGFADAYNGAKTSEEKDRIVQRARGAKLRNGYVMGNNPEEDHAILEVAGKNRANQPGIQVKRDVADIAAGAATAKSNIAAAAAITVAQLNNETRLAIAQVNAKARENKPLSVHEQALVTMYGDGKQITDVEGAQKALEFELAKATAAGTVKQGQIAETMNNILGGNTQAAMPKQPGVPAPSPTAPKTTTSDNTKPVHPLIGKSFDFTSTGPDGKPSQVKGVVIGVTRDGSKLNVKFPDGSTQIVNRQ